MYLHSCQSCIYQCDSCKNNTSCTQCSYGFQVDSLTKTCKPICPLGLYYNTAGVCVSCDAHCSECLSSLTCITCQTGYTFSLSDSRCNEDCVSSEYYIWASNICVTCGDHCPSCLADGTYFLAISRIYPSSLTFYFYESRYLSWMHERIRPNCITLMWERNKPLNCQWCLPFTLLRSARWWLQSDSWVLARNKY